MAKTKQNLNTIYISEKMQEQLRLISEKPFTAVVAPMGYGKSTAINRYLNNLDKRNNKVIRINVYSESIPLFWSSFREAFKAVDGEIEKFQYPYDAEGRGILTDIYEKTFCQH